MNPKKIGLDKFQKYLNKGYTSHHNIRIFKFAHYLTEQADMIASNFRGAKLLGNNYSKGSFLNITVETLLEIRKNWIKAGGNVITNLLTALINDHFNLYNLQFFQQFSACDSLDRRPQRVL
jgi:hypothetical protein